MRATSIALAIGALLSAVSAAPYVLPPGAHVPEAASLPKVRLALEASVDEEKRYGATWKRDGEYEHDWKRDPQPIGPGSDKTWKRGPEPQKPGRPPVSWKREASENIGGGSGPTWKREPVQASEDFTGGGGGGVTWKREPGQASKDGGPGGGFTNTWKREHAESS